MVVRFKYSNQNQTHRYWILNLVSVYGLALSITRGHPCTLYDPLLCSNGNEQYCQKGGIECEVVGQAGLEIICDGGLKG